MERSAPLRDPLTPGEQAALADERDLVARSIRGDTEAFRDLVAQYYGKVYAAAYRALGDHAQAEDVTQEVFLKVYRNLPSFKHEKPFSHWVHRIAANAATDQLRSRRPVVSLEAMERLPASTASDPQDVLSARETQRALREGIARLPKHYRQALALQAFHGYSYQAIATALDIPVGTVMSRLHSAKRLLRQELRKLLRVPE